MVAPADQKKIKELEIFNYPETCGETFNVGGKTIFPLRHPAALRSIDRMNLWNRQINMVSQGDLIKIENGTVARFRGERQLRIGKHGKITVVQDTEPLAN